MSIGWPDQHGGLGLDAADAPAQHRKAVDHHGVAVGADQRIGQATSRGLPSWSTRPGQRYFEVDLVADAGARRDDAEIVERHLAPAQNW